MIIENEFDVAADPSEVYSLMLDVERVGPCLSGTEVLGLVNAVATEVGVSPPEVRD